MESKNLKCEWDVLRKWIYFEANFKNRSAFLKVGQWNKMAQTPSPVRDTVVTVTLVLEVRILPIRCFALFKMNIHVISLIFPGIHYSFSHLCAIKKVIMYVFLYGFIYKLWIYSLYVISHFKSKKRSQRYKIKSQSLGYVFQFLIYPSEISFAHVRKYLSMHNCAYKSHKIHTHTFYSYY